MRTVLRAVPPLLGALVRRLLREGMIRRALGFPVVLTVGTLLITLVVVSVTRGLPNVAVTSNVPAEERAALRAEDLRVYEDADPRAAVGRSDATAGWDGSTLYHGAGRGPVAAEEVLRRRRGAAWWPTPPRLPSTRFTRTQGTLIGSILAAIYALYGVVFGAGMVARDRDDGTLEVELALPLPRGVHGLVRWLAGSAVLGLWVAMAVALAGALMGLDDLVARVCDGVAGSTLAVALGLASVGRAGLRSGFAGSLAAGLTATTALLGVGVFLPEIGRFLPLASIVAGGAGWPALLLSIGLGLAGVGVFTWRSARA